MDLATFEAGLADIIGSPSSQRPFVCRGSPLDCEVFVVGYNPATAMDGDWWRYWRSGKGFDREAWWSDYLAQRGGGPSKTRRRSNAIVEALGSVRCLEANIDARPSKRKSEYPMPVTAPFDFVLSACRPRVIIAHGVDAVRHLSGRTSAHVIECAHFIYVGERRSAEIVDEARTSIGDRRPRILHGDDRKFSSGTMDPDSRMPLADRAFGVGNCRGICRASPDS